MKILLIGSGAREHALAYSLKSDASVSELHAAPGNPGIGQLATLHSVIADDPIAVSQLAKRISADLVVIGPEAPLVAGVADAIRAIGIPCFGPSQAAAALEGSKSFAKEIMASAGVPTAQSITCTTKSEIENALDTFGSPYVVKNDGLAAGKGVVVTSDRAQALHHALACGKVVIEEFLDGPEISLFGISDGTHVIGMEPAQDFKRAFDNDEGPNTGGMGAYSPLPWAPKDIIARTEQEVLIPTINEMAKRNTPFVGLLYAGLAMTSRGLRVIEFNARFGDPETEVLLPRLKTPLAQLLYAAATGNLAAQPPLQWSEQEAVTIVLASEGYPERPTTGREITGPTESTDAFIFHAGTRNEDGKLHSSGGRVFAVTGLGSDLNSARENSYRVISQISLKGSHYRKDIALAASIAQKEA
ncbi:MAG: phosphoribosylamine--glycine ligase [Actinobacteria bacterium]|uniref:Phosphoribosylamine--glycine ligase n=1 Tax=Candidatus Fonsibacter lacus TaxID=2576439 RepID=A0A965GDG9_9PROT|nr:phosphoribosylamine--glycine ligase [Candidatus Fonsibacter lacus]